MHDLVIPHLTSPLLLSDFLTASLDRGADVDVLMLSNLEPLCSFLGVFGEHVLWHGQLSRFMTGMTLSMGTAAALLRLQV